MMENLSDLQAVNSLEGFTKLQQSGGRVAFIAPTKYTANKSVILKEVILNTRRELTLLIAGHKARFPDGESYIHIKSISHLMDIAALVLQADICKGYIVTDKCKKGILLENHGDGSHHYYMKGEQCHGLLSAQLQDSTSSCPSCSDAAKFVQEKTNPSLAKEKCSPFDKLSSVLTDYNIHADMREFIEEQILNSQADPSECTWSEQLLELCMRVMECSSQAYMELYSCPFISLPSPATLHQYKETVASQHPSNSISVKGRIPCEDPQTREENGGHHVVIIDQVEDIHAWHDNESHVAKCEDGCEEIMSDVSGTIKNEIVSSPTADVQGTTQATENPNSTSVCDEKPQIVESAYSVNVSQGTLPLFSGIFHTSDAPCDHQYANPRTKRPDGTWQVCAVDTPSCDVSDACEIPSRLDANHHEDADNAESIAEDTSKDVVSEVQTISPPPNSTKQKRVNQKRPHSCEKDRPPPSNSNSPSSAKRVKVSPNSGVTQAETQQELHQRFKKYIVYDETSQKNVFKCPLCNTTMSAHIGFYTRHLMRAHNGGQRLYCEICNVECKNTSSLKHHMNKHTLPFKCDLCDRCFAQLIDLQRHEMKHKGELPLACPHCAYRCRHASALKAHMRKHEVNTLLKCDIEGCNFATAHSWSLTSHKRSKHCSEKQLLCEHCSYTTSDAGSLRRHVKLHLGQKQYMCSRCSFRGVTKYDVVRHMRSHTNEKIYFCDRCSFSTAYSSALRVHMMMHLGVKPWQCSVCGYNNIHKAKVNSHITSKHAGEKGALIINLGLKLQMNPAAFCRPPHTPNSEQKDHKTIPLVNTISVDVMDPDGGEEEDVDMDAVAAEEMVAVDCVENRSESQFIYIADRDMIANIAKMNDNVVVEESSVSVEPLHRKDAIVDSLVLTAGDEGQVDAAVINSIAVQPHPSAGVLSAAMEAVNDFINPGNLDACQLVTVRDGVYEHSAAAAVEMTSSDSSVKDEPEAYTDQSTVILTNSENLSSEYVFGGVEGIQFRVDKVESANIAQMPVEQCQFQLISSSEGQDQLIRTALPVRTTVPAILESYQAGSDNEIGTSLNP